MADNLELRHNTWYATLHVPTDVRNVIGRSKFFQSLKTPDKNLAKLRAAPIIAGWKQQIAVARGNPVDPFLEEALMLRDDVVRLQTKLADKHGKGYSFPSNTDPIKHDIHVQFPTSGGRCAGLLL